MVHRLAAILFLAVLTLPAQSTRELNDLNWMEYRRLVPAQIQTVLLPTGTVEAHGVINNGADNTAPLALARAMAPKLNALVAPPLNYGVTGSLDGYAGTFQISEAAYRAFVTDIFTGLARNGFRNIIVINGHGGPQTAILNDIAEKVGREQRVRMLVSNWWAICSDVTLKVFGEDGGHAGWNETAFIQAIDEKLVHPELYSKELETPRPAAGTWAAYPFPTPVILYQPGQGSVRFDKAKASVYFQAVVERMADLVKGIIEKWDRAGLYQDVRSGGVASALTILSESALAQLSFVGEPSADAVMLNANENPLGPCPEALEAMNGVLKRGGRYLFGETIKLSRTLAQQEGLPEECARAFAGSSDPLHRTVLAFCSPSRSFVVANPGYEAGERAAEFIGAPVHRVPLTKSYGHDVKAMLAAGGSGAGVFYVCNPNNPTGTLTAREDIEYLVKNKPAGSIVMVDEAYIHFSDAKRCTDMVAAGKDVIVLRTFSKIYGMAGLRAGAAFGRPDLLSKMLGFGTGYTPSTGMVGASVSLSVKDLVPQRKKYTQDVREGVFSWMTQKGYSFVPSVSNKFMVDVKRPAREVIASMAKQNVYVGRAWPIWPTQVRVTVGTREEMEKFKSAFERVMA